VDSAKLRPLFDALHRYAGWLDGDRASVTVRADVEALGTAIDTCADPTALLQTLDTSLARLPGGAVRKILRTASAALGRAVAEEQRGQPL
jgi:hypothetical protein